MNDRYWNCIWLAMAWAGAQAAEPPVISAPQSERASTAPDQPAAPKAKAQRPWLDRQPAERPRQSTSQAVKASATPLVGKPPALGLCDGN